MLDRQAIAFALMSPADLALGAAVSALRMTGTLESVTDSFYRGVQAVMTPMFERNNSLEAEGLENVPMDGGVLFAVNHQSWNDVQVVGATCPRRLRFLAKSMFEDWPILRHMITLSDSPFVRRGGDQQAIADAVRSLQDGKALVIFPEGTIPGEEDVMRHEVEPDTGLLRGRTGAVRLAVGARVPVVPVGVSGTGAALPPEVYPRLELLEAPKNVRITVRYGKPITFEELYGRELGREDLRAATKRLMLAISSLVEHERNFVPLRVPIAPLPRFERLGVLLLHGFTSSLRTVDGLVPYLQDAGIPYRMPILRGHGTRYEDMAGVKAQDWYEDAEAALLDLRREVDGVVVVGLSMGGLVALDLGTHHADKIAGIATMATALRFRDPLAVASPILAALFESWPSPNAFNDESLSHTSENYERFMTGAFVELYRYARKTEKRLGEVTPPLCVIHSKKDQIADPVSANLVYRGVSSTHREIHWFRESGHEMGQDMERHEVFKRVMDFVGRFQGSGAAATDRTGSDRSSSGHSGAAGSGAA